MILECKNNLNQWEEHLAQVSDNGASWHRRDILLTRLSQLTLDRKPSDTALLAMTQNVASRLDAKTRKSPSPRLSPKNSRLY
jgi:hypothetical protein